MDDDTLERWHAFARRHDVDLSPLLEAIGRMLDPDADRMPDWQRRAVAEAGRIRRERKDWRNR